ncbi:MAG: hypothetical protein AAF554_01715 [Bacteroidota bacterium]
MKKWLEKQIVFNGTLRVFAFFAKRKNFTKITYWATQKAAHLNLFLNKPKLAPNPESLAKSWQNMMPPDGQKFFKITEVTTDTAYTEIRLHCPLRGTGQVEACYKLMNYDRTLMKAIGGELIVLESQSNSGNNHCKLAIRRKGESIDDLIPAHHKK